MLRVPSLKPIRLRGVCASGVVEDVLPKPSCDHLMTTLPKPIRARLRIACTATCGSSAHAWTHRSPPLRFLSRLSPANRGRSTSASGRWSARSNFPKREGPKPIVSVSRDGLRPSASPVSSGGASARPPYAPSPTALPAVIRRAAAVQSLSICTNSARSSVVTSNAAKCSRSCTGVAMPAWWAPWNSTAAPASAAVGSMSSPVRVIATAPPAAAAPSASPAPPQPMSARREGAVVFSSSVMAPASGRRGDDGGGELGQRLRERVHTVRQLLVIAVTDLVVGSEVVRRLVGAVLVKERVQRGELLVELGHQGRVVLLGDRLQQLVRLLGALDVGLEVDEVGVRVALLLAGDLAGGDLVEELLGAVGHRGRGDVRLADPVLPVGEVGDQLVGGVLVLGGDFLALPGGLLEPVPAGPLLPALQPVGPHIDLRVDVPEGLGDRLGALPADPGGGVGLLGGLEVAGPDRGGEGPREREGGGAQRMRGGA